MNGKSQTFPSQILLFTLIFTLCDKDQNGLCIIAIPITLLKCGEKHADLSSPMILSLSSFTSKDFVRLISFVSIINPTSFLLIPSD